ncbi:MAG: helix-turn-helix domain-containing protein [Chloroflexi bacterium]|jgi:excisionase family DNA binding protein|nr:PocR ligand-binding domain-containing protein [Anaerolineaceae bacterium]NMB89222.1 helix-turn-helix domain-containing protein [Chloroflexota bacterium]
MAELLTVKQLQELLKIDRVTVYRMLNDGRLNGVKIGNQWRFPSSEIDRLTGEEQSNPGSKGERVVLTDFPSDCVEKIQGIFAGILGVGAVTVSLQGEAFTTPCFSNPLCKLVLSSPTGCQACKESWRRVALRMTGAPPFLVCHAGLSYLRAPIRAEGSQVAWLIAGQFYTATPGKEHAMQRIELLARKHALNPAQLKQAAQEVPVLKTGQQSQVQEWTPKVAATIESILKERSELMCRLQRIAELSTIQPALPRQ